MQFRLHYRGPLKSGGGPKDKQRLRRSFLPQLKNLWEQRPLVDQKDDFLDPNYAITAIKQIGEWNFASIVNSNNHLIAALDIVLLQPEEPGKVITQGGDIDNRLKTLFDALSVPSKDGQIPPKDRPAPDEDPFHCLLEDDYLITTVSVTSDRLLDSRQPGEVLLLIRVDVSCTKATLANLGMSL